MAREPHPEMQAIFTARRERGIPRFSALSIDGARQLLANLWEPPEEPEPVAAVRDLTVAGPAGSLPIRVYTPDGSAPFPVLVYFHGGGWVMGSLDTDDGICRALTNTIECVVVSVDYRLAPEHPFPAAVEDCYAATEWVVENPEAVHGDPDRLAVGGESAGGNLAAAVALHARDHGPRLAHQVLIYPPTDHSFLTTVDDEHPEWYVFTKEDVAWVWNHYLESDFDGRNPYASPLQARDLHGLPPATVLTCGFDRLRAEGIAYAERLLDADVRVEHRDYDDSIHGFIGLLDDPELRQARAAITAIGDDLQESFGSER
ncbi:alpha/beta hydrolase [Haladaptatus sp. NG-SE-30]